MMKQTQKLSRKSISSWTKASAIFFTRGQEVQEVLELVKSMKPLMSSPTDIHFAGKGEKV